MSARPIARAILALAFALPGTGCVTSAVWEIQPASRLAVDARHRVDAAVEVLAARDAGDALMLYARRTDHETLPAASGFASTRSFWRLDPTDAMAEARWLLRSPEDFEVERVDVRMRREVIDDYLDCRAEVEVVARAVRPLRPVAVAPAALPAAVLDEVLPLAGSDLMLDHTSMTQRMDLLTECAQRLRRLGPKLWSGRLIGCAWLDVDGRLLGEDTEARLLMDLAMDDPPGGHLDTLRRLQLLAVVAGPDRREFFALEPDRVWLWSSLDVEGDRVRHRSEWLARPVARPYPPAWVEVAAGTMQLDFLAGRIERDHTTNVALKVLLTPVAMVLDTAIFLLELPSGRPFDREASRRRLR